jgi:hypothetical protein
LVLGIGLVNYPYLQRSTWSAGTAASRWACFTETDAAAGWTENWGASRPQKWELVVLDGDHVGSRSGVDDSKFSTPSNQAVTTRR